MCGRFSVTNHAGLAKRFKVKAAEPKLKLKPMYNVAPSQSTPVVLNESPDQMKAYAVSTIVNSPKVDNPELIVGV